MLAAILGDSYRMSSMVSSTELEASIRERDVWLSAPMRPPLGSLHGPHVLERSNSLRGFRAGYLATLLGGIVRATVVALSGSAMTYIVDLYSHGAPTDVASRRHSSSTDKSNQRCATLSGCNNGQKAFPIGVLACLTITTLPIGYWISRPLTE